jgi:hypothetical protein
VHSVVATVNVELGREEEGPEYLQANVLPTMKQVRGLVSGYWLWPTDGRGLVLLLFESQETAEAAAAMLPDVPRADFATLGAVEVRRVAAHI